MLAPVFGQWYVLFNLQSVILVYLLIKILNRNIGIDLKLFAMLAPFFGLGLWEALITSALGVGSYYGWTQFAFGFAMPVLLIVFINKLPGKEGIIFFRRLYEGYTAYLILSLGAIFFFDQNFYKLIENYGLGGAIVALRYNLESTVFGLVIGNANKQSNYLLLLILLGPRLLSESTLLNTGEAMSIKIYCIFSFVAVFMLIMLFSRAALLLLPFVTIFVSRYLKIKFIHIFRFTRVPLFGFWIRKCRGNF